ncbi:sigma-70 family RNA polymerase sigma factor [Pelotomaculum terephthalicicum JT]|uniref:sigma-70 family RNA polymerase sigma factor n=1 Tax=Pelotomaculum terephthalicicum TaxID=206393 RepID=UPI001F041CB0|nr:sigma-70 family RNA polymerase sigma factor [Pelotomaculum terephthalicicum]MCG9966580.1 sigma-70 family RNA polymerase sigma factor [Pelotomaculum terephthalicicum JT]
MNPMHNVALPNEQDLVDRSVHDPAAFADVYDYYLPRIYKYIRYRIGDPHEAEDLTSKVFELVVAKIGSYQKDKAPFSRWIFAIAHNKLTDYIRAQKRNRLVSIELMDQIACAGDSPVDTLIRREKLDKLLKAMTKLGGRERDLISLKFAAGLTNGTISEITGLTKSNVAVIIYRAVKRLRSELSAEGWD